MGGHPLEELRQAQSAGLPRYLATISEGDQRRDAADSVALRNLGLGLGIELGESHLWSELSGCLLERRRHRPAGAAPRRPEVDDERQFARADVPVEIRAGEPEGMPFDKGPLAVAAGRGVVQPLAWHAVGRVAVAADDEERAVIVHEGSSELCGPRNGRLHNP
jgi:hypothetical protein